MTDSNDQFDVIVVGVGAMGSAACYQLARRGLRVLGLEQFPIGHDRGSSHGQSRMIRMAYYEHPDYVPLLRRAYELWDELEQQTGQKLLFRTGGLYMGPPTGGLIAGSLSAARLHGLPHELLTDAAMSDRFAPFRKPPIWAAMFEPNAGFLLPTEIIKAYVTLAKSHGATIADNEPVLNWSDAEPSATTGEKALLVKTSRGVYRTRKLLICGGAWSARLVANLGVPLVVTRQVLGWVRPTEPDPLKLGSFPVWAVENPDGSLQYGFPILPGEEAFKVAWHGPGLVTDPDKVDRTTSAADAATFLPALPHILPNVFAAQEGTLDVPSVTQMQVCLYTNSPDHHFIIDHDPTDTRITFACGFSGHGFKFASVIGEVLAQLTVDGRSSLPVSFLSLKRFL